MANKTETARPTMTRVGNAIKPAGVAVLLALLSGCLESADTICFRPGVYQGAADPLIGNSDSAALEVRFKRQMDR